VARSENHISKRKIEVRVVMNDGAEMMGFMFGRRFIPLLATDGMTHLLNVGSIARVCEISQEANAAVAVDPYDVLGVPYRITDDELAKAYHDLCRQFHPDRIAQFDLPKELVAAASAQTARIIDAYNRVKKLRAAAVRVY
jgi:DnaJ-domain-containing protein 1